MTITSNTNPNGSGNTRQLDIDLEDPDPPGGAQSYKVDVFVIIKDPLTQNGPPNPIGKGVGPYFYQWCDIDIVPQGPKVHLTYKLKGVNSLPSTTKVLVLCVKQAQTCAGKDFYAEWVTINPDSPFVLQPVSRRQSLEEMKEQAEKRAKELEIN